MIIKRILKFNWELILEYVKFWKVEIFRLKTDKKVTPFREHVVADFRKAEAFGRFRPDFCCSGKKSIEESYKEKQIYLENNNLFLRIVRLKERAVELA
ncbi:MAG TPA: DUF542 domain-containing protein [Lutibacter sp.]